MYYDYKQSIGLWFSDMTFYALLMAAMRKADSANAKKLREAFPEVWEELVLRRDAPGGKLEGE